MRWAACRGSSKMQWFSLKQEIRNNKKHITKTTRCLVHCRFLSDLLKTFSALPTLKHLPAACVSSIIISQGNSLFFFLVSTSFLFLFCISSTFWSVNTLNTTNGNWINQQHTLSSYPHYNHAHVLHWKLQESPLGIVIKCKTHLFHSSCYQVLTFPLLASNTYVICYTHSSLPKTAGRMQSWTFTVSTD